MSAQGWAGASKKSGKSFAKSMLAAAALAWYVSNENDPKNSPSNPLDTNPPTSCSSEANGGDEFISASQNKFLGRPLALYQSDRAPIPPNLRLYGLSRSKISARPCTRPLVVRGRNYSQEFLELNKLGSGAFGSVFKSQNVLDGNLYAVKKITIPIKRPNQRYIDEIEQIERFPPEELLHCLREPQSMASIGHHSNIVRYHHAWLEIVPSRTERANRNLKTPISIVALQSSIVTESKTSIHVEESSKDEWKDDYSDSSSYEGSETTNSFETNSSSTSTSSDEPFSLVLYIQMELCSGASLYEWLRLDNRKVDAAANQKLFKQLLRGLSHLHAKGYCHRDVKPANLLIVAKKGENKLKVGDFGTCKRISEAENSQRISSPSSSSQLHPSDSHLSSSSSLSSLESDLTSDCGTYFYMAPELASKSYDSKVDIFAAGIVLFELFHAFSTEMERNSLITQLRDKRLVPKAFLETFPNEARIVLKMTHADPSQRPSADELLQDPRYGLCPVQDLDYIIDV